METRSHTSVRKISGNKANTGRKVLSNEHEPHTPKPVQCKPHPTADFIDQLNHIEKIQFKL